MSKTDSRPRDTFRVFAGFLGIALLSYLILRTGAGTIVQHAREVGWGLVLIFALGGVSHAIKTWAWRITFQCDLSKVSFLRGFALRLISEAVGTFGLPGQVLGEAVRVSLLGPSVPVANSVSAATLDRGLYTVSAAIVSVIGILVALVAVPLSKTWRLYALLFAGGVAIFVAVLALAMRRRWPVISGTARVIGQLPGFKRFLDGKQSVVDSAEKNFLGFYHETPKAFWASLVLNLACQGLAILEIYLLLHFMGARISFLGAFVLEALTKFISVIGAINPGNVGTYEGGNMIITRLFGVSSAAGLTLGLCRRARGLFWAAIGAVCMIVMSKTSKQGKLDGAEGTTAPRQDSPERSELISTSQPDGDPLTVLIVADESSVDGAFVPALARVGTLPVLLRTILTVQSLKPSRLRVCVDSGAMRTVRSKLERTGRLPKSIEWCETVSGTDLALMMLRLARASNRIVLLLGNRTYQPALLQSAIEWKSASGALVLNTESELAGIYALTRSAALEFIDGYDTNGDTLEQLDVWVKSNASVTGKAVPSSSWQKILTPDDQLAAERKLDTWLVKATDGLWARMNRRVSIPISRQLIKFPITPNMVSLFTLLVSFAAGYYFALGGYWNMLIGAVLSVWSSILDGCDGEVARIKLQSSDFGCWLETVCDYLYYLFIFGGMSLGLTRTFGNRSYLAWGALLGFGAMTSFLTVGFMRQHFARADPEKFLTIWQKKAEGRKTNPLLYLGRQCEFIIRRCFLPYALLGFALLNITEVAFIATAVGSNVVWLIALYSSITLSGKQRLSKPGPVVVERASA
ncbi:MAG TPA: lysylphosphatidylglycerol synthase domain-containing protein [Candidatus Binatia bacterium]|nr:lysylphosphatidylglycerol synthase domain-containing protein [Candidatus Binatia bacterium]